MNGEDSSQVVWTAAIVRVLLLWSACIWLATLLVRFGFWDVPSRKALGGSYSFSRLQLVGVDLMTLIVSAILFVVLWRFSLPVARYIWRSLRVIGAKRRVSFSDLQVVAYTALGLYLIVSAVRPLANDLMVLRYFAGQQGGLYWPARDFIPRMVVGVVQLVCGLFLFFNTAAVIRHPGGTKRSGEIVEKPDRDA
ncbi:MAG TPA: hypothetical protein VKA63_12160 [Candidatus Krumholzibacteria bacterium]|nr:hypothetical protein [Candidatus Krumholzibacteria bacterium]